MSGPDYRQLQEVEEERFRRAVEILTKAKRARQDGYFNDEDIRDMQAELGLSTLHTPYLTGD